MNGVTFGDIFFIVMVGGGIYFLLHLVNRSRKEGGEETPMNDSQKNKDPAGPEGGEPPQSV